jgi:hypothetical protein
LPPRQWREKMRKILISLTAGAALLGAGYAFEAHATMGTFQGLKQPANQFSPVEKADCAERGWFCAKGATLQCDPVCVCVSCAVHPNSHKHHKA